MRSKDSAHVAMPFYNGSELMILATPKQPMLRRFSDFSNDDPMFPRRVGDTIDVAWSAIAASRLWL